MFWKLSFWSNLKWRNKTEQFALQQFRTGYCWRQTGNCALVLYRRLSTFCTSPEKVGFSSISSSAHFMLCWSHTPTLSTVHWATNWHTEQSILSEQCWNCANCGAISDYHWIWIISSSAYELNTFSAYDDYTWNSPGESILRLSTNRKCTLNKLFCSFFSWSALKSITWTECSATTIDFFPVIELSCWWWWSLRSFILSPLLLFHAPLSTRVQFSEKGLWLKSLLTQALVPHWSTKLGALDCTVYRWPAAVPQVCCSSESMKEVLPSFASPVVVGN